MQVSIINYGYEQLGQYKGGITRQSKQAIVRLRNSDENLE